MIRDILDLLKSRYKNKLSLMVSAKPNGIILSVFLELAYCMNVSFIEGRGIA